MISFPDVHTSDSVDIWGGSSGFANFAMGMALLTVWLESLGSNSQTLTPTPKGKMSKKGFAFFVPETRLNANILAKLGAVFKPGNVAGAGGLISACTTRAALRLYGVLTKLKTKGTTRKEAVIRWNCCCEKGEPDPNVLKLELDGKKEKVEGPAHECPC